MADKNLALDGTTDGAGGTDGSPSNINDNDEGTYYQGSVSGTTSGTFSYWCEVTIDSTDITKAEMVHYYGGTNNVNTHYEGSWSVKLYYGSAWYTINSGSWSDSENTETISNSTGWNGVTKIRLEASGEYGSGSGYPAASAHRTFELRLWGSGLDDSKIRIYSGSSNIKIGSESLDGHKLRFYNGSETVGIPLLSTGDTEASSIRIYDGSGLTNMASDGSTSHSCTKTGDVVDATTCSNTYDEDINTAYKVENIYTTIEVNTQIANITSEHTWSTSYHVIRARGLLYMYYDANGGSQGTNPEVWLTAQLFLKISGSWTKVKEYSQYLEQSRFTLQGSVYKDFNLYTGWDNVTGIKVFVESKNKGFMWEKPRVYVYEAQAWVDTGGTVKALPKVS